MEVLLFVQNVPLLRVGMELPTLSLSLASSRKGGAVG